MDEKAKQDLLFLAQNASDSRLCKHLYLRGNFQQDMFYDKIDKINVWNRIWLSAFATETEILSVEILDNHLHITAILKTPTGDSQYMHHLRLSITQYHNIRYNVHGTLGTRRFKRGFLKDLEDIRDCVCYHIRNVLHHGIRKDFLSHKYSTGKFIFGLEDAGQIGFYTSETLPDNLAKAYLPLREKLPKGWMMTKEGMIVPPPEVFRRDILEALFGTREEYLATLSHKTRREENDIDDPEIGTNASHSRFVDEQVAAYVLEKFEKPIASMNDTQKLEAAFFIKDKYPKVSLKTLERLFGIPATTLRYRLKTWHKRE